MISTVLALAVVVAGALVSGALATGHFAGSPKKSGGGVSPQRQEALARTQAASWVAQQVSRDVFVSCDPAMCAALSADHFPAGKLLRLSSTSAIPVTSAVVVVTPAVRDMYGSSLGSAWAPAVLATFGAGNAEVTVRVMAPHGTGAYQAAVSADLAPRRESETALLDNNNQITISDAAQKQLAAGQVDSRLVLAIASLAKDQPIDIVRFGNVGSGASAGVPLRFADMAVSFAAAGMNRSAYIQALQVAVSAITPQYQPTSSGPVAISPGQTVFRVEFAAPSPLGGFNS
jgi:hypothetical protein